MTSTCDGIELLAIGYKYSSKKTLFFCAPVGAGGTIPGKPYVTKWPDEYGNVCTRNVLRLVICSRYFKYARMIDNHNQMRQHELALEKKWVTQDCWFRLYTSIIGMTVVDSMLAIRSSVPPGHVRRNMPTKVFAEGLSVSEYKAQAPSTKQRRSNGDAGKSFYFTHTPFSCLVHAAPKTTFLILYHERLSLIRCSNVNANVEL